MSNCSCIALQAHSRRNVRGWSRCWRFMEAKVISAYLKFRRAASGEAAALLQALAVEMRKDAGAAI